MASPAAELRSRIDAVVDGPATKGAATIRDASTDQFSSYVDADVSRATALASSLMQLAEAKPGIEGLADAVAEMEQAVHRETPGLVPYAVKLFLAHWPAGERLLASEQEET